MEVIAAVIGTGFTILCTLLVVAYRLGGRLSKIEAHFEPMQGIPERVFRLEGMITGPVPHRVAEAYSGGHSGGGGDNGV